MYEFEKTPNFRFQYNKLSRRMQRFVEEAIDVLQENPFDFQGRITYLSKKKESRLFRFRVPGAYIIYMVPNEGVTIILINIKVLY